MTTTQPTDKQYRKLEIQVERLLKSLKADIGDEYRASDEETIPGMCVTIGATWEDGELSWNYQTGDNSFTGGAYYCYSSWGVISLYRRSNCKELAHQAVEEIADSISQSSL